MEPSAGTGALVRAVVNTATGFGCCQITAIEINPSLAAQLRQQANENTFNVICADFLNWVTVDTYHAVIMNPPFQDGADIKHIIRATGLLRPGGILVALCANGPRQQAALQPLADHWEVLPAGSFKEQGTNVSVALLVIRHQEG